MKNNYRFRFSIFFVFLMLFNFGFGQVKLSFINESDEEFKTLKVEFPQSTHIFKSVKPQESTLPIIVSGGFRYYPLQITTATDTLNFTPVDFVGEKFYTSGKIKMFIKIYKTNSERQIEITSNKD